MQRRYNNTFLCELIENLVILMYNVNWLVAIDASYNEYCKCEKVIETERYL